MLFSQNLFQSITLLSQAFFQLGFTPCKAEQPLRCIELQEKEAQKDYSI